MWLCDPNRRAETLLRLAGREYRLASKGTTGGDRLMRLLERAVDVAPGPRTYLALGTARCERGISDSAWMRGGSPAAGVALGGAALVSLTTAVAMRLRGFVLPTRWLRDPEREMLERYLAMLPPAESAGAAAKEG